MRKYFIFGSLLCFLLILCSFAQAAQATGSITVTVLVRGSFNLLVDTDSVDFARLMPGQKGEITRTGGVVVAGTSTNSNPWYLKVAAVNPLSSGNDFIPNENFTWYGTSEDSGSWLGAKEKNFSETNNTAYISSFEESETAKRIINKFKFGLRVPQDTKPGVYTTTVMFTMTE